MPLDKDQLEFLIKSKDSWQAIIKRASEFQRLFDCPEGQKVLDEIKKLCNSGFDRDPYQHAFNAGKRFVYEFINNCLTADTEKARLELENLKNAEAQKKRE